MVIIVYHAFHKKYTSIFRMLHQTAPGPAFCCLYPLQPGGKYGTISGMKQPHVCAEKEDVFPCRRSSRAATAISRGWSTKCFIPPATRRPWSPWWFYQALYGERGIWVRPAAMWSERVERDGYAGPRFRPIEEE